MARKFFVSYKYGDTDVMALPSNPYRTKVRDYVNAFEERVRKNGMVCYKGEHDNEDLSYLADSTLWEKLKDRIWDSTVTAVFISPNMRSFNLPEKEQWIPNEVSYSLRKTPRNGRTSQNNSLIYVVLPDRSGSYRYPTYIPQFEIIKANKKNGYAKIVQWNSFMSDIEYYIELADKKRESVLDREISVNL